MALFTTGALTRKGQALIAKSETNGTGIKITKAVTGSGAHSDMSPEAIEQLTALTTPEQTFEISDLTTVPGNEGQAIITVVISNNGLKKMYYLNELGIYAEDPDDGEILYCVVLSENNTVYIPPDNESGGVSTITERIYLEVTNAEKTTIETEGAVVSATDFLALRRLVEAATKGLQNGTGGQILGKGSGDDYDYTWIDKNTIARPIAEFPETGQADAIYIDTDASEIYVWKLLTSGSYGYFKLPLGAEASSTLQKQITENANYIASIIKRLSALEAMQDEMIIAVAADGWTESTESGISVYVNTVSVAGMTEKFAGTVAPYLMSSDAADIVKEQEALGVFGSRCTVNSVAGGIELKSYKKCPKVKFGIKIKGAIV
jgi:hypothetical protein